MSIRINLVFYFYVFVIFFSLLINLAPLGLAVGDVFRLQYDRGYDPAKLPKEKDETKKDGKKTKSIPKEESARDVVEWPDKWWYVWDIRDGNIAVVRALCTVVSYVAYCDFVCHL